MLIADTKITVDGGTRYEFEDKLTGEIHNVITGFSGEKEPFTEFRMRFRERARDIEGVEIPVDRINLMIGEIMKSLNGKYGKYTYDIIAGVSMAPRSILTYFYQDGGPEEIKKHKAIGAWQYGSIFLNKNWRPEMNMETVAKLGYFIIKYIEI